MPDFGNLLSNLAGGALGNLPQNHLSAGLSDAFRSSETPPFGQLLSTLFTHSDGNQRAGILNHLLSAVGGNSNILGGATQVGPEEAQQVSPEQVQQLAEHAEQRDPSIIDRVSSFYAQHPGVVQSLGSQVISFITSRVGNR